MKLKQVYVPLPDEVIARAKALADRRLSTPTAVLREAAARGLADLEAMYNPAPVHLYGTVGPHWTLCGKSRDITGILLVKDGPEEATCIHCKAIWQERETPYRRG